MEFKNISGKEKNSFNAVVPHPLQSYEWGELRKKTGLKIIRAGFSLTLHRIPKTPWYIGYLPKGNLPDEQLVDKLKIIGKKEKCIFIQLEPNVVKDSNYELRFRNYGLIPAAHPLFTRYTFILDLTKSEEELLKAMHPKARYNIRVAQRHGVEIIEDNSEEAFEEYWNLMKETTKRQKFYAHTKQYHKLQWETFNHTKSKDALTSHLFLAKYKGKVLTAWMLFVFKDKLYYPYGASSSEHRETMHSSLMMWEAIKFGKKSGLKKFDLWGALEKNADPKDPWFGFHDFKRKFGPEHIEFIGSYDLIIHPLLYQGYKIADRLRWLYLKWFH